MCQRYQRESCHLLAPTFPFIGVNRAACRWLSSPFRSDQKSQTKLKQSTRRLWLFTIGEADCMQVTKWRRLPALKATPTPNFILGKTPGNNEIWCCNIKVVEKAVFQWCYLSCSVPTPCNDDLSLFSVLCSIFIYDQASFTFFPPLYFFGFIILFFGAIPATNEKIKTRNILCALWEFTRQGYNDEEQNVLCYVLNALTQILLFPCLVSTRHSCPYSFSKRKPSYSHSDHLSPTQRTFNKSFCVVQIVPLTVLPSLWFFCACFPLTVESMQVDCGEKRTSEGKTEA